MIEGVDYLPHKPLTEQQALGLLEEGDYTAYCSVMNIRKSKSGESYFVATLEVYDKDGMGHMIVDWFTLKFKLKHYCESAKIEDVYQKEQITRADLENHEVKVKIGIQKGNDQYPNPKNVILDYLKNDKFKDYDIAF